MVSARAMRSNVDMAIRRVNRLVILAAALAAHGCGSSGDSAGGGDASSGGAGARSMQAGNSAAGGADGTTSAGAGAMGTAGSAPQSAGSGAAAGAAGSDGSTGGSGPSTPGGACPVATERVRITEIDVGTTVVANEEEAALMPVAIAPVASGGSRVGFMGADGQVHVATLDADDQLTGAVFALPAHDFGDLYADDAGGVLLLTRDAEGGGTLNCGEPTNLCGTPPNPAVPCYDMYMVRFDGTTESWATKLTDSSSTLPPYSTGPTGPNVYLIWWYAHHGRIGFDGTNYAGYFGSAISVSQDGCINIHQGDRMKVVGPSGALVAGGFDWGCSHSGYERIVWDEAAGTFVTVCKTDNDNRLAFAPDYRTIRPVDLAYSDLGDVVVADGGGYWVVSSDLGTGQPAGAEGLAEVHLLHVTNGLADQDLVVAADAGLNARAPHLAPYGDDGMLLLWETSSQAGELRPDDAGRQLHVQTFSRATGEADGDPLTVAGRGNRYHALRAFPDGSVAMPVAGSSPTKISILRVLPCRS